MATGKIQFTKEKETLLMTLYGRALQSRWEHPILRDSWAEDAVRRIDYDFSTLYGYSGLFGHLVAGLGCAIIATRAGTFDRETARYLAAHPEATTLHLGCGLDSRVFRVDPPASVTWFDVDYPDVIAVRRRLFPERPNYHLIGAPLEDLRWLDEVPRGRPALVVAEGVLMYLSEANVQALLHAVTGHFPSGQLVFDAVHPWVVRRTGSNVGGTGASYRWGLDEPRDLERLDPKLELVKEYTRPELVAYHRFPLAVRALFLLLDNVPALRRMERPIVYRF